MVATIKQKSTYSFFEILIILHRNIGITVFLGKKKMYLFTQSEKKQNINFSYPKVINIKNNYLVQRKFISIISGNYIHS